MEFLKPGDKAFTVKVPSNKQICSSCLKPVAGTTLLLKEVGPGIYSFTVAGQSGIKTTGMTGRMSLEAITNHCQVLRRVEMFPDGSIHILKCFH